MILPRSPNARWITLHILNTRVIWCHFQTAPIVDPRCVYNPWPLRYRCSAPSTGRAGLRLFILPFTGLFGTNIMTSTQLAYTAVRWSAFNYHCLQLTRLVLRRSLQNNTYRYLTVVSIFTERQRYSYKHESIATLIEFDCPLNMESMVLVNAVWAPDEKNTSFGLL